MHGSPMAPGRASRTRHLVGLLFLAGLASSGCSVAGAEQQGGELLIPDLDRTRTGRIGVLEDRFVTPPGFTVEQAASAELVDSIMPEGLLDVMSLPDLVDPMTFLERGVDGIPVEAVAEGGAGDR